MIATDDDLLAVLNSIEHQPRHNILFAGVQYLMMRDGGDTLERFYPNFTENPEDIKGVGDQFRDFVLKNAIEITEIGRTRFTQTNECRRCVALVPGIWATTSTRFHLVDFGTSAGLNLHLDRYHYRWGDVTWGPTSPVRLSTETRGTQVIPSEIEVLSRTGLDLSPIDSESPDDRRWLEALIWPEHHERRERLRAALVIAEAKPVNLIAGNAFETLVETLQSLPAGKPAVVINSFILNQFEPDDRTTLGDVVETARAQRHISRVSLEWLDTEAAGADLAIDVGDGLQNVGLCQPHGEWLELYARP